MSRKPTISLSHGEHNNEKVICLRFDYNRDLINLVKSLPGTSWSRTMGCWYMPKEIFRVIDLRKELRNTVHVDVDGLYYSKKSVKQKDKGNSEKPVILRKVDKNLLKVYTELLERKNYSKNTLNTYVSYFRDFTEYFAGSNIDDLHKDDINAYILKLIREKQISTSQQNQRINAIKFYYERVLGREKEYYNIDRPKKEKKLPTVLSKEETNRLFEVTENLKHKCILMTIYSGGLRRSELINLRIDDIDSKRMLIKIRGSKGNKDRYTLLSEKLLDVLREYYRRYKPEKWLFEGQEGGRYSTSSILKIFKKAVRKAGIRKYVTPHSLRHSFATHLLEQGISLRHIQELLGHNSSQTTEIYTHVATNELGKITNPLDD